MFIRLSDAVSLDRNWKSCSVQFFRFLIASVLLMCLVTRLSMFWVGFMGIKEFVDKFKSK